MCPPQSQELVAYKFLLQVNYYTKFTFYSVLFLLLFMFLLILKTAQLLKKHPVFSKQ